MRKKTRKGEIALLLLAVGGFGVAVLAYIVGSAAGMIVSGAIALFAYLTMLKHYFE